VFVVVVVQVFAGLLAVVLARRPCIGARLSCLRRVASCLGRMAPAIQPLQHVDGKGMVIF